MFKSKMAKFNLHFKQNRIKKFKKETEIKEKEINLINLEIT